jgi:hypothetical protein
MFSSKPVSDPHCDRFAFEVNDVDTLARTVALVLIQEFDLAKSLILGSPPSGSAGLSASEISLIINRRLKIPHQHHRDGFLFQLMMWLSSHIDLPPDDLIALPHSQPSAKGQDSIIVHRSQTSVNAISICEDKATKSPRTTINSKVWPEIKDYEGGGRDDELRSSVIATLGTAGISTSEATKLIRSITWSGNRRYRVRVTVGDTEPNKTMFMGFAKLTPNGKADCRGETVYLPQLRSWMDSFSAKVETELRLLAT